MKHTHLYVSHITLSVFLYFDLCFHGFPGVSVVKNPPAVQFFASEWRALRSVPGSGRSPGGGNGNPLQHSCLENPRDRGAWQPPGHEVTVRHNLATDHTVSTGSNWPHADGIIIKNDGIYEHLINFYRFICYHLLLFHCKQFQCLKY